MIYTPEEALKSKSEFLSSEQVADLLEFNTTESVKFALRQGLIPGRHTPDGVAVPRKALIKHLNIRAPRHISDGTRKPSGGDRGDKGCHM